MARIRSIKPEVRISEKVNSWPLECRYFWVLLWGYCDDYGYGRDNARLIVADSFPLDDKVTAEMVSEWMNVLWMSEVITRFAVGGSLYFQVINWKEHQQIAHPAKRFLPTIEDATEVFQQPSVILPQLTGVLEKTSPKQGAGSSEQGAGKGSSEVALTATEKVDVVALFDMAYEHWPKREKRAEAFEKFKTVVKTEPAEDIAHAIVRFGDAYALHKQKQFVPALGVWLNGKRWTDDLPVADETGRKESPTDKTMAVLDIGRRLQAESDRKELTA